LSQSYSNIFKLIQKGGRKGGRNCTYAPIPPNLGIPPYSYVICHSHTKQVKRFLDWTKGEYGGKLKG